MDLFAVSGKVALVTGGSRGIGEMIATGFVAAGVRTYISSRKADDCEQTADRLSAHGKCIAIPADLSTADGIDALCDALAEREESLHILTNNAGTTWGAPLEEFPEHGWDKVMDLNVKAPFLLTQRLLPMLKQAAREADPGRVINIGSVAGIRAGGMPTFSYGTSKAAIHHLTRILARNLAPLNITVNAIAPGPFDSKMMAHTLATEGARVSERVPLRRIGRPTDVAGAAIYLSSAAGSYVTGVVLPVDGGLTGAG